MLAAFAVAQNSLRILLDRILATFVGLCFPVGPTAPIRSNCTVEIQIGHGVDIVDAVEFAVCDCGALRKVAAQPGMSVFAEVEIPD